MYSDDVVEKALDFSVLKERITREDYNRRLQGKAGGNEIKQTLVYKTPSKFR